MTILQIIALVAFIFSALYFIAMAAAEAKKQVFMRAAEAFKNLAEKSHQMAEKRVECWVCPSCRQFNRLNPVALGSYECQNCYEIRPKTVELSTIPVDEYRLQMRLGVELARREWQKKMTPPPDTLPPTINFQGFIGNEDPPDE